MALITAFPDEKRDDLRDTIHYFLDSLRFDHAEPQLSLLAPLGATPIYEQHKDELVLDHIFSDVSHQGWHQDPADLDLIKTYPEIFSNFYAVPTTWIERSYFKEVRDLVTYLALRFRWLPVGLLQDSGDFLKVFDRWRIWRAENVAFDNSGTESDSSAVPYHCGRQFVDDSSSLFLHVMSKRWRWHQQQSPRSSRLKQHLRAVVKRQFRLGPLRRSKSGPLVFPSESRTCRCLTLGSTIKSLSEVSKCPRI